MIETQPGRMSIRGIRYLMIQPTTLVGFQKAAESAGGDVASWLEAGGRAGGRASSTRFQEVSDLRNGAFAQAYLDMGAEIGWGVFRVTEFDADRFEVAVDGSPFAEAYGASPRPVCDFTRGVIAGLGDTLFGAARCEEVECAATGARRCKFVCHA